MSPEVLPPGVDPERPIETRHGDATMPVAAETLTTATTTVILLPTRSR